LFYRGAVEGAPESHPLGQRGGAESSNRFG
jgi:hypothetical protein